MKPFLWLGTNGGTEDDQFGDRGVAVTRGPVQILRFRHKRIMQQAAQYSDRPLTGVKFSAKEVRTSFFGQETSWGALMRNLKFS